MLRLSLKWMTAVILLATALRAQESMGRKSPSVTMTPPGVTKLTRGKAGTVELQFRVNEGFHINSNKPKEEYLIPTVLKLEPPTEFVVGKATYPDGKEMSFAFAPDEKISVYSGIFSVQVQVRPLTGVLPGKYEFRGNLRYQACDNAQCYPPKNLPLSFEVNVLKAPRPAYKNPGQSPHVHG